MEPYLSLIFQAVSGRSLFVSNTITVSERWGSEDLGGWIHYGISLLGIGPGGIGPGDVIVRFAGVEQGFFFRPEEKGRHQMLGDGHLAVLGPENQGHDVYSFEEEIVLVWRMKRN